MELEHSAGRVKRESSPVVRQSHRKHGVIEEACPHSIKESAGCAQGWIVLERHLVSRHGFRIGLEANLGKRRYGDHKHPLVPSSVMMVIRDRLHASCCHGLMPAKPRRVVLRNLRS
jgi:hypothetical protein